MTENEFLLQDRIQKIKSMNELYDLENNAYISFSGGKDSTVLHYLFDIALPNNKIPRVFINTGIEFEKVIEFIKKLSEKDDRIVIIQPKKNIKETLEDYGYPFKSKVFAHNLSIYQHSGLTQNVQNYLDDKKYGCPSSLKYTFTKDFDIKVSEKCCYELKKKPSEKWAKENNKTINITGIRASEGGGRRLHNNCTVFQDTKLVKFNPLLVLEDDFINEFIKQNKIELCELYYPPYNFIRTGCKGCPYSLELQKQLDVMSILLPKEKKQCEYIWKPIYAEYRKLNYRLRDNSLQGELF